MEFFMLGCSTSHALSPSLSQTHTHTHILPPSLSLSLSKKDGRRFCMNTFREHVYVSNGPPTNLKVYILRRTLLQSWPVIGVSRNTKGSNKIKFEQEKRKRKDLQER